ncbi:unnamed protein product [Adineta steineri]|uniref:Uncharacterized protein n=1 Tax=Adineta steineri TaxID=433720 RepID=A0A815E3J1_9BILA|nr:unnamed protein product [Adineta steineri]
MTKEIGEQIRHVQEIIQKLNIRQSNNNSELTNDYGYIKFGEDDIDIDTRLSQYIRLALQTNARTIVEFLKSGWRLPTPDLIISVTGGGKRCQMSTHLRRTFQRGLVVSAATTNAWLITAGTNTGVVKLVGEALNNYRYKNHKHGLNVPCIGIGSWKYTAGNKQLENLSIKSSMISNINVNKKSVLSIANRRLQTESVQSDVENPNFIHSYVVKQSEAKRCDLEPNHTHFLLFDGKLSNTDGLLLQRAKIEQYSRRINTNISTENALIPIVMILVEGGPFSVRTVCHALQSNTPLVVVKGSGRAADLVAELHNFFSEIEIDETQTKYQLSSSNKTKLDSILEQTRLNNNPWIDEVKDNLCHVLYKQKQLVVIFEFDNPRHGGNLEDAILEALLNATKFSGDNYDEQQCRMAELKLAMAWQKLDYTKKYILTDTSIAKLPEPDLCEALIDALRRGYIDFIELLIDYGASLKKLTLNDLEQLYSYSDIDSGLPLEDENEGKLSTRNDYYSCYFPDNPNLSRLASDKNLPLGQNATREFFLWAIFVDRFDLSTYLCSKTWNQFFSPLIAAQIYRQASSMALHSATRERYENNAVQFDKYATEIIDQCFLSDENFAVNLLKQSAIAFDNIDPLHVAEEASCQSFLASDCVQRYLDHKWYGHINYKRRAIHFRIMFCSLVFPLIPVFSIFLPYVRKRKQIIESITDDSIGWFKKMMYFYDAPIVRFCYNLIFFILYLALFSYVILIDYFPLNISHHKVIELKNLELPITEIILHICTWNLIIEEFRQISCNDFSGYIYDIWNLIDITAIILYLIAFATRFVMSETFFVISKIFLCLDLIVWFIRILHLFSAFERLGPKLVMIFNTMRDLFFFICFILVFLCGFSITSWSLITSASQINWIYDDDGQLLNVTVSVDRKSAWTWKLLRDIAHYGVWKVFGQVDPIVGTDSYSNMAFVLAIIFVAIANILLLNVLIALFNVTIQNVQEQSHNLWRYQRFSIVNEFSKKSPLPPPFSLIYHFFRFLRFLIVHIKLWKNRYQPIPSEITLDNVKIMNDNISQDFKINDMMRRESAIAEDYWRQIFKQNKSDRIEIALTNIEQKIDRFIPFRNENKHTIGVNDQSKQKLNVESDV